MNSEALLDFRFSIRSPEDVHQAHTLNRLMETSPNPMGFQYIHGGAPSSGRFRMCAAGELGFFECRFDAPAGSNTVFAGTRSRSHLARNQTPESQLAIWLGGEINMRWGKRTHTARAGDILAMDNQTTFNSEVVNFGQGVNLFLPPSWERIGDTRLENIFGKPMRGDGKRCAGLTVYVRRLLARPGELTKPGAAEKIYDVIALALNPDAKSAHRAGLLALIHHHIETYCGNPALDSAAVAAQFNISVRHLNRLFATSDISFGEYLLEQRLDLAQHRLGDGNCAHQTIIRIALDCGFRDINHFGRRFRERYGLTPGEFRRRLLSNQDGAEYEFQQARHERCNKTSRC